MFGKRRRESIYILDASSNLKGKFERVSTPAFFGWLTLLAAFALALGFGSALVEIILNGHPFQRAVLNVILGAAAIVILIGPFYLCWRHFQTGWIAKYIYCAVPLGFGFMIAAGEMTREQAFSPMWQAYCAGLKTMPGNQGCTEPENIASRDKGIKSSDVSGKAAAPAPPAPSAPKN